MTFTLDGQTRDVYTHAPVLSAPTYEYDQLFFSEKDLPNSAHTFTMSVTAGTARSFAIFDYLTYVYVLDMLYLDAYSDVVSPMIMSLSGLHLVNHMSSTNEAAVPLRPCHLLLRACLHQRNLKQPPEAALAHQALVLPTSVLLLEEL